MPSSGTTGGKMKCIVVLCTLLTGSLATAQIPQSAQSSDTQIEYQSCKSVAVNGERYFRVVLQFRSGSQSFYGPYSGHNVFHGEGQYAGEDIVSVSVNTFGSTITKDNPLPCNSGSTTSTTIPPTSTTTTLTTSTTTPPTITTTTTFTTTSPSTTSQSSTTQNTESRESSTSSITSISTSEGGETTTQPVQSPVDSSTSRPTTEENNSTGNVLQSQGDAGTSQNRSRSFPSILLTLFAVVGLLGLVGAIVGWKYRDRIFLGSPTAIEIDEQFDSLTERDIFDFVTRNPGTNIASIAENLEVSQSTVQNHLRNLTADGYLDTQSLQGSNRYFVAGEDGQYDRSVAAAFANEELRELISTLHQHGPLSGSKLSGITEKDQLTILRQLDELEERGIINRVRDGDQTKNELTINLPAKN